MTTKLVAALAQQGTMIPASPPWSVQLHGHLLVAVSNGFCGSCDSVMLHSYWDDHRFYHSPIPEEEDVSMVEEEAIPYWNHSQTWSDFLMNEQAGEFEVCLLRKNMWVQKILRAEMVFDEFGLGLRPENMVATEHFILDAVAVRNVVTREAKFMRASNQKHIAPGDELNWRDPIRFDLDSK